MTFHDDGTLLITSGDGFNYREKAQDLDNHFGKILRINTDGSIPQDNPFIDRPASLPEIWSYGHRNPQGILNIDALGGMVTRITGTVQEKYNSTLTTAITGAVSESYLGGQTTTITGDQTTTTTGVINLN